MADAVLGWLLTYFLHSTILLAAAWLADRAGWLRRASLGEAAWRCALLGGLLTASLLPGVSTIALTRGSTAHPLPISTQPFVDQRAASPSSQRSESRISLLTFPAPTRAPVRSLGDAFSLPSLSATLLGAWGLLALGGVLRLLQGHRRLRREIRALPDCQDDALRATIGALAARARITAPTLKIARHWDSPAVTLGNTLCLPHWTLQLPEAQREAMTAHEIAHLRRRDPAWRLATELLVRLLPLQPLNRIALRRLEEEAELACDAWAARAGGGSDLAACLVACAERLHGGTSPKLAVTMARRRAPLTERVRTLLEESPMSHPLRTLTGRLTLAGALVVGTALLPTIAIAPADADAAPRAPGHVSIETIDLVFHRHVSIDADLASGRLRARIDGDLEFNAEENDVASMDDEAWFEQERGAHHYRIEFEAGSGGAIERRYFVDGDARALDADGRTWLAEVIPTVLRETAWNAEARVARIRAARGVTGVLAEIAAIASDHAHRSYVEALAASGALTEPEVSATLAAVAKTQSDFERRVSYAALIEKQRFGATAQTELLQGVATMESSYEQREVLVALAPTLVLDETVMPAWRAALQTIESDFEARVAIVALAERDVLTSAAVTAAIEASRSMQSSTERRFALTAIVPHVAHQREVASAYAVAAGEMTSAYEKRVALVELIEAVELDRDAFAAILDAAAQIDSDFECRVVLVEVGARMPADAVLIARYRDIAGRLSGSERSTAEDALQRLGG